MRIRSLVIAPLAPVIASFALVRTAAAQIPTMVVSPPSVSYTVPVGSVWSSDVPVLITSDGAKSITGLTRTIAYGASQPTGWLKATLSGSATPAILSFQVDAALLVPGSYDATVTVKSKLTGVAPQSIAVKLTVTNAPPAIVVARTATLTGTAGSLVPVDLKIDVTNGGGGKLGGLQSTITYPGGEITGWLTAALGSPDAPTKLVLRATPIQSLLPGVHHASVVITAKGTSNSPQTVDVSFNVTGVNPAMQLTPSTVTFFGILGTGDPASQAVTISNLGGGTIEGLKRSTTYAPGEPIGWLKASLGGRTGTTLVLSAFTAALSPGLYTATVQVTSTTAYNSPQTVTVRFAVANSPAHLTVTPNTHDFGSVGVGGASAAQAFTITNDGGLPSGTLTGTQGGGLAPPGAGLAGNNPGDFRVDQTSSCAALPGGVLASHASCDIVLWFSPTAVGPRSAALALGASPGGNVVAGLSGTGTTAQVIIVTPLAHDYGDVGLGLSSPPQRFVLTNPLPWPTGPLQPLPGGFGAGVMGGPNPGDFYFDPNSTCAQALSTGLAVGGSCYFDVTFIPLGLGPRSATLVFQMTPGGVVQIPFSGNGVTAQFISVTPATYDFGTLAISSTSVPQRFTITNDGQVATGPLTGSHWEGNINDFGTSSNGNCPELLSQGLAPGASCYFDVTFTPSTGGLRAATLQFMLTPGGVANLHLSGTGTTDVHVSLAVAPQSFDFGGILVGQSSRGPSFSVTNTGNASFPLDPIALSGDNPADFVADQGTCTTTLAPTASCTFHIRFTPTSPGARTARATASGVGGNASAVVALTGRGKDGLNGNLAGTVRDLDGVPLTGASLGIIGGGFFYIQITTSQGTYEFPGVAPATYALHATHDGCSDFEGASVVISAGDDLTRDIALNCPPRATGTVTVVGPTPGAMTVQFTPVRGGATIAAPVDNGHYDLALPPDEYAITVPGLPTRCASSVEVNALSGRQQEIMVTDLTVTCGSAFAIAPASYDFGPVAASLGNTRTVVLTLTNQSDAPAATGLAGLSSDYVWVFRPDFTSVQVFDYDLAGDTCSESTLGPNETCTLTVNFFPRAGGTRHATLSVAGVTAQITGTGDVGIQVSISPNPHDFGTVNLGVTRTALLTVTNNWVVATAPQLTEITLGGTNASEFTRVPEAGDCVQAGVEPGASCTLRFAFAPTSTGPKSALVTATFHSAVPGWAAGSATAILKGTGSLTAMIFLSSSKNPSVAEEDVTLTARVTHPDGSALSPMPVGLPITFVLSKQANKIVPLGSDGTASVKTSFKTAGAYPIAVSFADDILGVGSNSLTQLVTPLPGDPTVGRVAGAIHDRDGQPVAGVTVFLIGATVPTPTTAADGSYEMNGIPPGTYTVLATKNQFCVDLDSEEFTVSAQQTTTVSLTMNCPPLLYGTVTATGAALTAFAVQATPVRGGQSFSGPVQSDGAYSLFIGADEYNVAAVGPLRCRSSVETIDAVHQQDLVTADLTVTCSNEIVRITPVSHDFGGVRWGQASSPATFTVTNVTEHALPFGYAIGLISPYTISCDANLNCDFNSRNYEFAIAQNDCGSDLSLAAGASCSVAVRFTPLLSGLQSGTIGVCSSCNLDFVQWYARTTLAGHGRDAEATLAFSPGSFDFGAVQVNTSSKDKQFVVMNTGPDASGPISVSLTGADAADFTLASKCQDATLAGNSSASCEVFVTFTPHGFGPRTATVTITGTPGGTASATLTGTGEGRLTIAPTAKDFGSVAVGQSGTPVAFTVTNAGSSDVLINHFSTSGPNFNDFVIDPGSCGPALAPTGSCTLTVRFTPTASGARAATLTVVGTGGTPTVSASLTGTGGGAVLAFTPASVDFGNRQVNYLGGGVAFFTVRNSGSTATPPLDQFVFGGAAAADFSISDQHCLGLSLAPGASCSLSVQFIPHATGLRSATLTVSPSTGGASGSAQVSGTGVPPAILTVTPASKDFGTVNVGQTSPVFTFTVTNTGPSPGGFLSTDGLSGVGKADYNLLTSECWGNEVNVGASCRFTVSFSPKGGGPRPATYTMVFQGGTATVNFTGVGTSPNALLSVSPDSQDFGLVFLGASSAIKTITVTNTGGAISGSLVDFTFTGPSPRDFGFLDDSNHCYLQQLAAGASCTIGIVFTPLTYGRRSATLTISTPNIPPATVTLTGGMTPGGVLTITPTSKNFGTVPVGAVSLPTQFTVTNSGTSSALFTGIVIDEEAGTDYALEAGSSCVGIPFLAVGASCTILVHFEPRQIGPLPATLFVYHDGGTVSADLTGTGATPLSALAISPDTLRFGSVPVGQSSAPATFTVTNVFPFRTGAINSFALTGVNTADYQVSQGTCAGAALDPGGTCTFNVTFAPQVGGGHPSTLTVKTAAGEAGATELRGFGIAPTVLAVTPDSHDFGFAFLGSSSNPVTFTVTNTGGSPSGVLSFIFAGTNSSDFSFLDTGYTCHDGLVLQPGASCTVDIIFLPQAYGRRSGTLAITGTGLGGGSATVILTGGITPNGVLTITPTSKNFETIPVGAWTLPTEFTVTNVGTTIAFLSGMVIVDPAGENYAFEQGSACVGTPFLEVGASCPALVIFRPQTTGSLPATLRLVYDRGTVTASLTGVGGPPEATPTVGGTMELTAFTATDAARDLLGVPTLTAAHRAYLDGTGNHNGTYDLGDLLAFFDRHHIKLSPALLAGPASKERAP